MGLPFARGLRSVRSAGVPASGRGSAGRRRRSDPDAAGAGVYVLSADVTAEVEAREALTHAARRALAAQMTSGLAHDFGNLMTIILGLQGRLEKSGLPPAAAPPRWPAWSP